MVPTEHEPLVHDIKLSSVVPSKPTGDDKIHEITNIDLAMKLHYVKALYFFNQSSVQGINISDLKKPMFQLLDHYAAASGRVRRSENGRPFVKCNDSGVRIVEADCSETTLEDWLKNTKEYGWEINEQLFYPHALGPDMGFSPLVFVQFTGFKCGGLSVGLSWAHVLGDTFAASTFINMWGHIMAGQMPPQPLKMPNIGKFQFPPNSEEPFSLKRVDTVGDYWVAPNSRKMETLSFHFTARKLDHIVSQASGLNQAAKNQYFHFLAALMWKSLAKVRGDSEPRVVTICRRDPNNKGNNEVSSNSQVIGTVEADFNVAKAGLLELAMLIDGKMVDERSLIEKWVERETGKSDFILYGSKVTFVNLEEVDIYGFHIKGQKPISANYSIGGVGDEGVVLVLPAPTSGKGDDYGDGRVVTAILPKDQNFQLKNQLSNDWGVF